MNEKQLKQLIRETVSSILVEGEAFRVSYTAKDGKRESRIFPRKNIADIYAKTVKNAVVEPIEADVGDVQVQKVKPATLDDLRASAKTFYKQTMRGDKYDPSAPAPRRATKATSSPGEDQDMDAYLTAKAAGLSPEDAWREVDYSKSHRRNESVVIESFDPLPEGMNVALGEIEQRWKDDVLDDSSQEEWEAQVDSAIEDLASKIGSLIEDVTNSLEMGEYK